MQNFQAYLTNLIGYKEFPRQKPNTVPVNVSKLTVQTKTDAGLLADSSEKLSYTFVLLIS